MSTALDLASLAAQGELRVPLARGVVSQGGSGTDYTGWSGVSSVFVEAKVEVREQSRGFATLALTVEGSTNGSVWSTLQTFTFGHGGSQSATVSSPPDHLRVSWAVGGGSEWQIIEVTAAPSVIDFSGNGGSQSVLSHTATLDDAAIKALPSAVFPGTELLAPVVGKVPLILQALLTTKGFHTNPYGNIDPDGQLVLRMGNADVGGGIGVTTDIFNYPTSPPGAGLTEFLDQSGNASDDAQNIWPLLPSFVYNDGWGGAEPQPFGSNQVGAGGGFYLGMNSSLGDLDGGDPANSLTVTLTYYLIDIPS